MRYILTYFWNVNLPIISEKKMFCTKYEIFDCFVSNWRRIYHCMIHTICNKLFIFILIYLFYLFLEVLLSNYLHLTALATWTHHKDSMITIKFDTFFLCFIPFGLLFDTFLTCLLLHCKIYGQWNTRERK